MLITAYPDIVRREGLAVEVVSGFASRSHGDFRRNPPAICWHHDASPAGPSPGVLDWMISNWNQASANAWVDYNGKWWFVGAGVAWHAGAVLPGMPGNYEAMGIETDYTVGETIPWNLYDSLRRGTAAILRANGQPASDLHFHKTICSPVGRKSDPWALDLGTERAAVAKLIAGGNSPLPLPDQSTPGGPGGADPNPSKEDETMLARRDKQTKIDYVYDSRNFIQVKDPTHWELLKSAGFIAGDHGSAPEVNTWDIEWVRGQVVAWGGRVDEYVKPGN